MEKDGANSGGQWEQAADSRPKLLPPLSDSARSAGSHGDLYGSFGFKCAVVLAMVLVFQIPMLFIRNLIRDRSSYHDAAIDSILVPKGGQPEFQGILLVVPYDEPESVSENGRISTVVVRKHLFVTPERFSASTSVRPEMLRRGIFEVPVFDCALSASGSFDRIEEDSVSLNRGGRIYWEDSLLMLGVSNKKVLTSLPELKVSGSVLRQSLFEPKIQSPFSNAVYYDLGAAARSGFEFEMSAGIQGGQTFSLVPIASENDFRVESAWRSPSFSGGWLPASRQVGEDGFKAEWKVPGLSTKFPKRWSSDTAGIADAGDARGREYGWKEKQPGRTGAECVTASFFQPVDNYQKATRSAKYSILFLLVPFIALLAFEVFARAKIHPVQYGLIGLANVVFYLLLVSVSEHIPFNLTYWISSAAVSLLMLLYGSSIFRKFRYGLFFAAVNLVSYIFLFGTLQAEDYALLIGSIGIFLVVCALMILTRKVDWYRLRETYGA